MMKDTLNPSIGFALRCDVSNFYCILYVLIEFSSKLFFEFNIV